MVLYVGSQFLKVIEVGPAKQLNAARYLHVKAKDPDGGRWRVSVFVKDSDGEVELREGDELYVLHGELANSEKFGTELTVEYKHLRWARDEIAALKAAVVTTTDSNPGRKDG